MRTRIAGAISMLAAAGLIAFGAAAVGAKTSATKQDSGTAYASVNRTVGSTQYVGGNITDKVLGSGGITAPVTLTHVSGTKFKLSSGHAVLFTRTGSLAGTLSATVTVTGSAESFSNGKLSLTNGAGSQKGHSLVGTFTGSGSTTSNQFTINYKGGYK